MRRRHVLMSACLVCGGGLAFACAFLVFNFVRLAQAQSVAETFVRHAVAEGSGMLLPDLAPSAAAPAARASLARTLDRARRIGPLVDVDRGACAVAADAGNICGGPIMVCIIHGDGRQGAFEADVALCRGNDTDPYRLAATRWTLDFADGDPLEPQDRSRL